MSMTILDLTPEALKKYHPHEAFRKRKAETRMEVAKRRRRAHAVALKAADLLKTTFGAKKVFLFGSLARRVDFTLYSDIDLAVRGIPSDRFLAAMDAVLHMDSEFKIDLVDLDFCLPAMREEIEKEGKGL